jgi:N utilization substance protein A
LAPAVPSKVIMDEEAGRMEVIVPDDQLSLAIGRRGQNVRLASDLSKWYIDVISESDESDKRQEEINERTKIFIEALDVDDVIAHLIVAEGYSSINDIADTSINELNNIEGFEEELSIELKERAQNYVKLENENVEKKLKSSGIDSKLYEFSHLSKFDILTLVENDIKTLDDLADLDSEELFILLGKKVFNNESEAGEIIMEARKHWFDEDYEK